LSNHPFDNFKSNNKNGNKDNNNQDKNDTDKPNEKEDEQEITWSFAQLKEKCYCNGKPGHRSPQCHEKNHPREEWAIHKAKQSHLQAPESASSATGGSNNTNENGANTQGQTITTRWIGAHIQFYQATTMHNWILLDNQSTVMNFCNPKMVTNIRDTNETHALTTNAGVLLTNKKADVPGWGEVWYNPKAVINIFSLAQMVDHHPVTYNLNKKDAFIVHLPHKQVKFQRDPNRLYIYKPPEEPEPGTKIEAHFINTVEENKKFYTQHQFE
jgi:hypothetical protein